MWSSSCTLTVHVGLVHVLYLLYQMALQDKREGVIVSNIIHEIKSAEVRIHSVGIYNQSDFKKGHAVRKIF